MWLSFSFVIAILVETLFPVAVGLILVRKKVTTWKQILIGCLMLLTAQALLIPSLSMVSNWLSQEAASDGQSLWMPIVDGMILGIISGVIVEGVRWIAFRFIPDINQSHSGAIGSGLGYGGIETIIFFGIPVLISFINMIIYRNVELSDPSLPEGLVTQVQLLWELPWNTPLVSVLERLSGMVMHITLSLLVVHSFFNKQIKFFFYALGWHSLYDAIPLILLEYQQPNWLIEVFLVVVSIVNLVLWIRYFKILPLQKLKKNFN